MIPTTKCYWSTTWSYTQQNNVIGCEITTNIKKDKVHRTWQIDVEVQYEQIKWGLKT